MTREDEVSPSWRLAVLGASAGGIDALSRTLAGLPQRPEFVTVVITHLDPDHDSALVDVLQRATALPIRALAASEALEYGTIHVLGPGEVALLDGRCVRLEPRPPGANFAIDRFLESAAAQDDVCVAAVVLSGIGSDGTAGAAAVRYGGGLVIAQDPASAQHDGMPQLIIEQGLADDVLAPEAIGAVLADFFGPGDAAPVDESAQITEALSLVHQQFGLDLSYYKDLNVRRRLLRRAFLQSRGDLSGYLRRLHEDSRELATFRDDLLIGVTAFFRDMELVAALEQHVFPELIDRNADPIRIWVPACSTGEEAYSVAMLLYHTLQVAGITRKVQIFGSDVNERAIQQARSGCYPAAAVAAVPEYLRSRYFVREENGWRIAKPVREMCVFAAHNVFTNAPFSHVDLVSARNFLIYLRKTAKRQAFEVFFYALRQGGHLLLGPSETADPELFEERQPALSLYRRRQITRPPPRGFSFAEMPASTPAAVDVPATPLESLVDRLALARYAPPGFVVDANGRVVQFRGDTSHLLQPTSGDAALSLARLVRPELQVDVRAALMEAVRGSLPVRRERVRLGDRLCTLDVVPVPAGGSDRYFLVSIQECRDGDAALPSLSAPDARSEDLERYVRVLGDELEQTRGQLRALVAEYDATSEALRTANEEILSANEELQSANEELREAKRDLEQANAHLTALNDALEQRNTQLVGLNDDLGNLIRGIPVPVLMLDREQRLRHFSPAAAELFAVDETSLGRRLDATPAFADGVLDAAFHEALQELRPVEREIQGAAGNWYVLWARAYQTSDSRIDGAVLAFQDIHHLKIALDVANRARAESERANTAKNDFLALVSHELRAPLNVIANWLQVLRVVGVADLHPKAALGLDAIDSSCRTQAQLISDLLDISRITSGGLVLDLRATDIAAVIRSLVETAAARAATANQTVAASGVNQPVMVTGDLRRLQQIFGNLFDNALKFTPAGGHIDVTLAQVGTHVEIAVTDTGIGIAADELPRVFDRFSQRDISKTREFGGMGLGLAIARNLTDAHGGSIGASSDGEGRGARFVVRLPLTPNTFDLRGTAHAAQPVRSSLAGLCVLVVDDEVSGRDAIATLFSTLGALVSTANDAFDALEQLERRHFDVIVADIAMPRMDGYELLRTVRRREDAAGATRCYAIALTGFASLGERDDALGAGFDAHFGKPADIDAIVAAIESGMRARNARARSSDAASDGTAN